MNSHREAIVSLNARAMQIETFSINNKETISSGASKIGGCPDLLNDIDWPSWKSVSLSFLCQINLADMAGFNCAEALPKSGLLSFFYHAEQATWGFDPKDRGSWKVLYYDGPLEKLNRQSFPEDLPEEGQYEEAGIIFKETVTLPPWESKAITELDFTDEQKDAYIGLLEELDESGCHRMFGHPAQIQGDMQLQCQLVSNGLYCGDSSGYEDPRRAQLEKGTKDWVLLLQLDSDEQVNMMWGDCGRLYFWVRKDDLEARDFEHVWMVIQCH
ncbi:MAG: DUF1963 domain-containing protein [Sedimentisphaerales bacterium]|nr:DUF1963 domain-containing protein [Sedimentisphaerales bacterium]